MPGTASELGTRGRRFKGEKKGAHVAVRARDAGCRSLADGPSPSATPSPLLPMVHSTGPRIAAVRTLVKGGGASGRATNGRQNRELHLFHGARRGTRYQ